MTRPYYEIVSYKVKDPLKADEARASAQETLKSSPGFIAWTAFSGAESSDGRVDLVAWRSLEEAHSAAKVVGCDPEFAEFRSSVASLTGVGHYVTATNEPQPIFSGDGIELGRFRLKPGVDEEDMRQAYAAMVESHLAVQPGWRRQHLIKLDDGVFIDLAFADSRARSEAICAGWQGRAACDAFLSLVEPESMEFGTVL